ncbi:MAG: hypothetical protein E7255_01165 [Lachnospiraceae bacterium]|jgi:hypothetical protein|nr:hypothetical protein [Lachnospiraceae bacterium]
MIFTNAGEVKSKKSSLSIINSYSSNAGRNQVGNNSGKGKKTGFSSKTDRLSISAEGIEMLQEQKAGNPFLAARNRQNNLKAFMESYQEQLEASNERKDAISDMAKLLEIARRISRGDKVPAKDEQKLMKFSPELYHIAKATAMLHVNEKHKKHKSMFDDKEKNEIRNKLNKLEQEDKVVTGSGDVAADAGNADMEVSTAE